MSDSINNINFEHLNNAQSINAYGRSNVLKKPF